MKSGGLQHTHTFVDVSMLIMRGLVGTTFVHV